MYVLDSGWEEKKENILYTTLMARIQRNQHKFRRDKSKCEVNVSQKFCKLLAT